MIRASALGATLLAALAVAGCGGDDAASACDSGSASVVRVGVQKDGVRSILQESGVMEGAPYKTSFATFAFGPPLVEAAGADEIDTAGVGSTPPIFGAASTARFKVVGAIQRRSDAEDWVIVPGSSPIRDPRELVGKRVAVGKGSSAHGYALRLLRRIGVDPDDVDLTFLAPADALAAYQTGRVDAWVVWEPYVSQAEALPEGARRIAGGPPDETGTSFQIASEAALDDPARREALTDFMGRLQRAYAWAATHQEQWAVAWAKESGLPESVTRVAVGRRVATLEPVTDAQSASQQVLADTLSEEQVIPERVQFSEVVEPGVVPAPTASTQGK